MTIPTLSPVRFLVSLLSVMAMLAGGQATAMQPDRSGGAREQIGGTRSGADRAVPGFFEDDGEGEEISDDQGKGSDKKTVKEDLKKKIAEARKKYKKARDEYHKFVEEYVKQNKKLEKRLQKEWDETQEKIRHRKIVGSNEREDIREEKGPLAGKADMQKSQEKEYKDIQEYKQEFAEFYWSEVAGTISKEGGDNKKKFDKLHDTHHEARSNLEVLESQQEPAKGKK